jgi:phosphotransferase system enzyme I (PtsI)
LVDGYDGLIILNPSEQTLFRYGQLNVRRKSFEKKILETVREPAETLDGVRVTLLANIESANDLQQSREAGADGVGLYRTEYLFLQTEVIPSEEMQFQAYQHVADYFGKDQVVIRTMDLGGDKPPGSAYPGLISEANPFLGFRAIRFCLENPGLFKDQLRAILRASAYGNVKIMFPMISGTEELDRALEMAEEAKQELRDRNIPFNEEIEMGSMIEIPSAAIAADLLAKRCDFFSVGTNDLIQYLLAVDRVNTKTAHLYEPTHPAVLRTLKSVFDAAHAAGIKSAICGEVAGDPILVPLLLGLGADELSASPALLPTVKYLIQHMKMSDAVKLAKDSLKAEDPKEIAAACLAFYQARVVEPE